MADLRLGENIVVPAIVVKEEVVPSYMPPRAIINGILKNPNAITSYSSAPITDIDSYVLGHAFYNCTRLTTADLSSLTTISGTNAMEYCFYGCTGLTTADLSSLTTISGGTAMYYCFHNCSNLTTADLSSLTTISGTGAMTNCFSNCRNLTSVDLSSLETISGSSALYDCFYYCRRLTEIRFPALKSFGTTTSTINQFSHMLYNVTGCTLHFPSNMQSEVERRSGYPNFGGTNTVVLFDLPPTA